MPAWVHQRAERIRAENPSMPESESWAIATQQGHALGKTPKSYGTLQGRAQAKEKYKTPEDDKKTASQAKTALIERLVRLGATDIPNTPRLLMKQRSPEELAALQQGVQEAGARLKAPVQRVANAVANRLPGALQKPVRMLGDHPEMIPMAALPIPGASLGYLAAKKGAEKLIDRFAPAAKLAFSTNEFSGPMNPNIASGASSQPGFRMPTLKRAIQKTAAHEEQLREHKKKQEARISGAVGLSSLGALSASGLESPDGFMPGLVPSVHQLVGTQPIHHGTSQEGARGILAHGLRPDFGGSAMKRRGDLGSQADVFAEHSKGKVFVTPSKTFADGYAYTAGGLSDLDKQIGIGHGSGKGRVVSGVLPYERFKKDFSLDTMNPGGSAYMSSKPVEPGVFQRGAGLRGMAGATSPRQVLSYLKNNPGRAAKGFAGLAIPAAALGGAGYLTHKYVRGLRETPQNKEAAGAPTRGGFMMASDVPAFKQPRLDRAIQKDSAFLPDNVTTSPGDFKRSKYALDARMMTAFTAELIKSAGPNTPATQLAQSQSVGAPKVTAPPGPSIADIAKPRGARFGTGIPGAFKTGIGGMAPVSMK